jgi:hypothetical protein
MASAEEDIKCSSDSGLANVKGYFYGLKSCSTCDCGICLDKINENCIVLDCGHPFHKECIKEWFEKSPSGYQCSTCRRDVDIADVETILGRKVNVAQESANKRARHYEYMYGAAEEQMGGEYFNLSRTFPQIPQLQREFFDLDELLRVLRYELSEDQQLIVYERLMQNQNISRIINKIFTVELVQHLRKRKAEKDMKQKKSDVDTQLKSSTNIFEMFDVYFENPSSFVSVSKDIMDNVKSNPSILNVSMIYGGNLLHYIVQLIHRHGIVYGETSFARQVNAIIKVLVEKYNVDPNLKNKSGETAVDLARRLGISSGFITTLSTSSSSSSSISKFFYMYFC